MPLKNIFPHLKNAQKIAESYGGYCFSDIYINSKEKLKWKCQHEDHKVWLATYKKVVDRGLWCVECGCGHLDKGSQPSIDLTINSVKGNDRQKKQLEIAKKHAESKGGKCLSEMYVSNKEKLTWKCKHENHKPWDARYNQVVNNGRWCPECGLESRSSLQRNSNGLEVANKHAESKGGKCLSEVYVGANEKLKWKCKHGNHKPWDARYSDVINKGQWCPECGVESRTNSNRNSNGLEMAKKHAESKGGKCLSEIYVSSQAKLTWKCKHGNHKPWDARYSDVINKGQWCPECGAETIGNLRRNINGLEMAKKYAESKGGKCLSEMYVSNKEKLTWKCKNPKHKQWDAEYNSLVNRGVWCPECGSYRNVSEFRVRLCLEKIFGTVFEKRKNLEWNKSPETGRFLELDGYSKNLKLAFEFQGRQHREKTFSKKDETLTIKKNDAYKKNNCDNNCVKLIVVDEPIARVQKSPLDFHKHILMSIKKSGIKCNTSLSESEIKSIFLCGPENDHQEKQLEIAKKHAESKDGKCLSEIYVSSQAKLTWKCKHGNHKPWDAAYGNVVSSAQWCPECGVESSTNSNRNSNGLEIAKKYAESKGGKCLSEMYVSNKEKLTWKCKHENHKTWDAAYSSVVSTGSWCPECGVNRNSNGLEIAKKYAESKDGKCLSEIYVSSQAKLTWKCKHGNHKTWDAAYSSVVSTGSWCPECGVESMGDLNRNSNGLEIAKKHAESKDGKCLSEIYVSSQAKLTWKCKHENHKTWDAAYNYVVNRGRWCPECSKEKLKDK